MCVVIKYLFTGSSFLAQNGADFLCVGAAHAIIHAGPLGGFRVQIGTMLNQPAYNLHMAQAAGIVQGGGAIGMGNDIVDRGSLHNLGKYVEQALLVQALHSGLVLAVLQLTHQLAQAIVHALNGSIAFFRLRHGDKPGGRSGGAHCKICMADIPGAALIMPLDAGCALCGRMKTEHNPHVHIIAGDVDAALGGVVCHLDRRPGRVGS